MLSQQILESLPQSIWVIRRLVGRSLNGELTFQQYRILAFVHKGMGQTEMSQNMQVSMPAVSKAVDALVKLKLLQKEQGEDRRCSKLTLTRSGEKIRKAVREEVAQEIERSFKKLTKKEQDELKRGLDVLDKLMGLVNEK